ncbi:MAG: hypothetical protein SAK29_03345 [Scytonema sp. PMC 1069.18]|nr:hypothetical protein [Scytonema sp. PMC 1069.18]MEC4884260.1 hypothetical protein [Scytonema sp. PMC 1070.18]
MILVKSVVIITYLISVAFVLWMLVSYHRTQQALHWWYHRQHIRMRQEGEVIRDKMLQELFVLRRYIELSEVSPNGNRNKLEKYDLENIEKIHHSFKQLSEYLYPAYIDDSLPLAIRCLLESWKTRNLELNIKHDLPQEWDNEPGDRIRTILTAVEELLIIVSEISAPLSIVVSLEKHRHLSELKIQLTFPNPLKLTSQSQELDSLCCAFKFIISGECFYYQEYSTQTWYFRWQRTKEAHTMRKARK